MSYRRQGRKRSHFLSVFVSCVALIMLVTGCGLPGGGSTSGTKEVVFWQPDAVTWQPMYKQLADQFMQSHPDIKVKVVNIPEEGYVEKLNTAFASGSGPDMWVGFYAVDEYKRGYIQSIDEFIAQDKWDMNQYFQPAVDNRAKGDDGKYYGLPRDISMSVVLYNKDLFDTYNVAYPTSDWTLDDMRDIAKKLTHPTDNIYGTDITHGLQETPLPWNNGADLFSEDGWSAVGYLDSPATVKYVTQMQNIAKDGSVIPSKLLETMSGENAAFASGTVGMSAGALWGYNSLKDLKFQWGVVPYPKGEQQYSWVDSVPYHMNAKSKLKQETWEFMKFMSGPEAGKELMKTMTWASPVKQAWTGSGLEQDEKLGVFYAEGSKISKRANYLRNSTAFDIAWDSTLEDALNAIFDPLEGEPMADPAEKLKQTAAELQKTLDEGKQKAGN